MFQCLEKPALPKPQSPDSALALFITRLELSRDDCADQLGTVKNHLEINGVSVTDVLIVEVAAKQTWWRF